MVTAVIWVMAVVLLACCDNSVLGKQCGIGADDRVKRIVGGDLSDYGDWPWLVGVRRNPHPDRAKGEGTVRLLCGGVLIHKQFVLTAAHCIAYSDPSRNISASLNPDDYVIRLGDHDRNLVHVHQIDAKVDRIILHNNHSNLEQALISGSNLNDLALLRLSEPLSFDHEFIQPICLPKNTDLPQPGDMLTVIGWGHTKDGGNLSDVIREAELPVASRQVCREATSGVLFPVNETDVNDPGRRLRAQWTVPGDVLCMGAEEGGRDTCQYDSGGPLMQKIKGRWYAVGIVSLGFGCAQPGLYGLYTRVDLSMSWIEKIIKDN